MAIEVDDVVRSGLCTGCGLCESVTNGGYLMAIDEEGFYGPRRAFATRAEDREVQRLLASVCPGLHGDVGANLAPPEGCWGSCEHVCTGYAADPELRFRGSSGGALSALLLHLLASGFVEHVIHIGPSETDPLRPAVRASSNSQEVLRNVGSRYAPASPLQYLDRFLETYGRFAFVGRPCDVCALRRYAAVRPSIVTKVRCTISFLCAGTPSLHATHDLLGALGVREEEVARVRYRGHGWPGAFTVETTQRAVYRMDYEDAWGGYLGRKVRLRCKLCFDSIGEAADVAFGDGWRGDAEGRPDFTERDGCSLILPRTPLGRALVEEAVKGRRLVLDRRHLREEELARMQPYHAARRSSMYARLLAARVLAHPAPSYAPRALLNAASRNGLHASLRQFLGTARRLLRRRGLA